MVKRHLCIDIDNVIAQTDQVMRRVIYEVTDRRVDLLYEHVTSFEYHLCRDASGNRLDRAEWDIAHDRFSEECYIKDVQPFPGVQGCLSNLAKSFELHLATSRLPKARKSTVVWLEEHGFPPHALHFLTRGAKHVCLHNLAAAVEDDRDQAIEFARHGIPCFLLAHPWNKLECEVADVFRVSGWNEIVVAIHEGF